MARPESQEDFDPSGIHKLLRLLSALRGTEAGTAIYNQVERMLDEMAGTHMRVEIAYAGFINAMLESYQDSLPEGSTAKVNLKLLQARLQPPLSLAELASLGQYIDRYADEIREQQDTDVDILETAVRPLLETFGISPATKSAQIVGHPDASIEEIEEIARKSAETQTVTVDTGSHQGKAIDELARPVANESLISDFDAGEADAIPSYDRARTGTISERRESSHEALFRMQQTLGEKLLDTIRQNGEFGVVLEVVLTELKHSGDVEQIEDLRWSVIREIEKLLESHHKLAEKLDSTHEYLKAIESDSHQLNEELSRFRLLSLTDELTGLSNRRAFVRRLEDEVARVQRYGLPLSLALIDLDHFKQINDEHGHAAGDEVLRVYARNVLSVFRTHDLVARYGGEEFAVLLPNTGGDGAERALNKVRERAAETRWQLNGSVHPVPMFSAGLSLYKPGESANTFIERADKALYRAKRLGRNRIELDMTYPTGTEDEKPGADIDPGSDQDDTDQ